MTNPENAIGTNGAFGGRTSPNAFNDVLSGLQGNPNQLYKGGGILSGWTVSATSADQITLGGSGLTRDVAIASDPSGNLVTVNNISEQPISVDMPSKPTSGSRRDGIIAYVQNPPEGVSTVVDNPGACGIIGVAGSGATTLADSTIRNAITADGGDGATAYYVVLATVTRSWTETKISTTLITRGKDLSVQNIRDSLLINRRPIWDTIRVSGTAPISASTLTLTSTLGNTYKVEVINDGESIQLSNVPNITMIETFGRSRYTAGVTGNLRVRRTLANSTVWVRKALSMSNGQVIAQGESSYISQNANDVNICDVASLGGSCVHTNTHMIASRMKLPNGTDTGSWMASVYASCTGAASIFMGSMECTLQNENYAPAIYKAFTADNIAGFEHVINILLAN